MRNQNKIFTCVDVIKKRKSWNWNVFDNIYKCIIGPVQLMEESDFLLNAWSATAVTAGLNWLYFGHTESEKEQGRSRDTVHVYTWSDSICASTAAQSPLVQEITHGCCLKGVKVKNELGLVVTSSSHAVSLSRRGRMRWSYCTAADTQHTPSLLKVSINWETFTVITI